MNAYRPIESMQRLREAGLPNKQAEAVANELHSATTEAVTKDELTKALDAQANKVTLRLGSLMLALFGAALALFKLI